MVFSRGREGGVAFTTAGTFRKYPPLSGLALHVAVTKKLLGYTSRRKGAWVESQHPRTRLTRLESGPMSSFHAQIELLPPPLHLDQNQAPTSLKTLPSPHRLFDSLDKLMHVLSQLSDFIRLKNEFYSFRAQTD